MKLIDRHMPEWDFASANAIECPGGFGRVPVPLKLLGTDFSRSPAIRLLFAMRGMPRRMLTLRGFLDVGFILLEHDDRELVIGMAAQPWKPTGGLVRLRPEEFACFSRPDCVKTAWNFRFEESGGRARITTETRIACTSPGARRKFGAYWAVVGPFSGIIRREMLRLIRRDLAEPAGGGAAARSAASHHPERRG